MAAPSDHLTISQQAFAIRNILPDATVSLGRGIHLTITAELQPTPMSRRYGVQIDYRLGAPPDVQVLAPELQLHSAAEELPHTFAGEKLCLHLPGEWSPTMHIAHTTVPWTSEWLFYYELWLTTGNWDGGGHGESSSAAGRDRNSQRRAAGPGDHYLC